MGTDFGDRNELSQDVEYVWGLTRRPTSVNGYEIELLIDEHDEHGSYGYLQSTLLHEYEFLT